MPEKPDFIVRGRDSQDYPASHAALWKWVREGRITRNQLIYDTLAERWMEAGTHPDLRAAFPPRWNAPDYFQRTLLLLLVVGTAVWIAAYSFTWGYIVGAIVAIAAWFTAKRDASPLRDVVGTRLRSPAQAALLAIVAAVLFFAGSFDAVNEVARSREAIAQKKRDAAIAEAKQVAAREREAALRREAEKRFTAAIDTIRMSTARMTDVAASCVVLGNRLPEDLRSRCVAAHLADAKAAVQRNDISGGRSALAAATAQGANGETVSGLDARLRALETAEARRREKESARIAREQQREHDAEMAERRRAVGRLLRERFLDSGMDVKVRITGKNADRIQMEWILFSDVWSHRLRKEGIIDELCNGGFTRVDLDDGYDWGVYFTCR